MGRVICVSIAAVLALGIAACGDDEETTTAITTNTETATEDITQTGTDTQTETTEEQSCPDEQISGPEQAVDIEVIGESCDAAADVVQEATGSDYESNGYSCTASPVSQSNQVDYSCSREGSTISFTLEA